MCFSGRSRRYWRSQRVRFSSAVSSAPGVSFVTNIQTIKSTFASPVWRKLFKIKLGKDWMRFELLAQRTRVAGHVVAFCVNSSSALPTLKLRQADDGCMSTQTRDCAIIASNSRLKSAAERRRENQLGTLLQLGCTPEEPLRLPVAQRRECRVKNRVIAGKVLKLAFFCTYVLRLGVTGQVDAACRRHVGVSSSYAPYVAPTTHGCIHHVIHRETSSSYMGVCFATIMLGLKSTMSVRSMCALIADIDYRQLWWINCRMH